MKLEGRDPDPGRRATVQEQVSAGGPYQFHSNYVTSQSLKTSVHL
jgi:hypothetical protein